MPAPRHLVALCAAALAVALSVAGCGESGKGLLSATQASRLENKLEDARRALDDDDDCGKAAAAAQAGAKKVSGFGSNVDDELRSNLIDGFNHLNDRINAECGQDEEKTPTPTATPKATATVEPTVSSTGPTPEPTEEPTAVPTEEPTEIPSEVPTALPTQDTGGAPGDEG